MPILDGISATKAIRGQGVVTPIIALTANAIHGDRERFINAEINDYLAKPMLVKHFIIYLKSMFQITHVMHCIRNMYV